MKNYTRNNYYIETLLCLEIMIHYEHAVAPPLKNLYSIQRKVDKEEVVFEMDLKQVRF